MRRKQQLQRRKDQHLSGTFWYDVGQAFQDPEKRFEFPIKPFEMDLTKETKVIIIAGTVILAAGMIGSAYIRSQK